MPRAEPTATRRAFLALTAGAAPAALIAGAPAARAAEEGDFVYEVAWTDAEWRERLNEAEYAVMREGATERPDSSPLAVEDRPGIYCCRGCELTLYESQYKVILPGFVFFYNSVPNAILMGIDTFNPYGAGEADDPYEHLIEAHCRRCGSHLGHILRILDKALHCINGTSMTFRPAEA